MFLGETSKCPSVKIIEVDFLFFVFIVFFLFSSFFFILFLSFFFLRSPLKECPLIGPDVVGNPGCHRVLSGGLIRGDNNREVPPGGSRTRSPSGRLINRIPPVRIISPGPSAIWNAQREEGLHNIS